MQQDGTKGKDETVNHILNECCKIAQKEKVNGESHPKWMLQDGTKEKGETVTRILNECSRMAQKEKMKQWIAS